MSETQIQELQKAAIAAIDAAGSSAAVSEAEKSYLGKEGKLSLLLKGIKDLSAEEKTTVGKAANAARIEIQERVLVRIKALRAQELSELAGKAYLDTSVPALGKNMGHLHPLTSEMFRIVDIFRDMGFEVMEPYMIDDDYHTFTSLNIPAGHPARDMWDTIRTADDQVLITHTSAMQNRIIKGREAPIRAIVPGKCFRNEATDSTHEHSFFQVEGIYVDKGIKVSDLLGTLYTFLSTYFGTDVKTKIQPTFFPFVEPGLEIMIDMSAITGEKNGESQWLEVIPCGMIHPFVLQEAGLDPNVYSGFAWGAGIDRLAILKNQIDDIRLFHSGRIDFINQFNS
jgi:phenylalanyl-tRNA synthetase alpha chain